jgi:glyoxylase-like metal-dependent hydrolase (beta-lactamase superfamily II)
MKQIYPDLWLTEPEHPFPEVPDLMMHAYLLRRDTGNVLFCRSEHDADHRHIHDLGGITHQYLTHWHEAAPGLARIKELFRSKLVCHRLAERAVSKFSPVELTFETREVHRGDLEVIPTPGHTVGSTCFRFKSPYGKTYLFLGDTIFPSRRSWQAVAFEDGNPSDLRKSLAMMRELEPDVVLCGASIGDVPFHGDVSGRVACRAGPGQSFIARKPIENRAISGATA